MIFNLSNNHLEIGEGGAASRARVVQAFDWGDPQPLGQPFAGGDYTNKVVMELINMPTLPSNGQLDRTFNAPVSGPNNVPREPMLLFETTEACPVTLYLIEYSVVNNTVRVGFQNNTGSNWTPSISPTLIMFFI